MFHLFSVSSPWGMVRKQLPRGPLDTLSIYWWRERFWGISDLLGGIRHFRNLEHVLFFFFIYIFDGTGWDGGQKCPLIFFTLCRCIRCISTYARNKIVPTFLWVSKFDAKLGCGRKKSIYGRQVTFLFLSIKVHMFTGGHLGWKRYQYRQVV